MGSILKCFNLKRLKSWIHIIVSVLFCCLATRRTSLSVAGSIPEKGDENNGCTAVKLAWGSKGLETSLLPTSTIAGDHLQVCSQTFTCCTHQMESKLISLGKQDLNRTLSEKIGKLRLNFTSQTSEYDAFCIELIDRSSRGLHEMFLKTYGIFYQQNSKIFTKLFRDLKIYYRGSDLDLEDVLETFFASLMRQMFVLLNSNYAFDERYLQCVTEQMDKLKPFGDVPMKLSSQVRRAFVATRTFYQGLLIGREVMTSVSQLDVTHGCLKAVTKMSFCQYCHALNHIKPCHDYCLNVMKGCLANHYELNDAWNVYIDSLGKLAERLEGPFNVENVVDPIDFKISEAIMNFQETNEEVFKVCGQPTLHSRKRRQLDDRMNFDPKSNVGHRGNSSRPATTSAGTNIHRLMKDFRDKISTSKDFWKTLPQTICHTMAEPAHDEFQCWNGVDKNRYVPSIVEDGLTNQISNPEVEVDVRKTMISRQILQLKMITEKSKKAFNGIDVDWYDIRDDDSLEMSGGSGDDSSGSGHDVTPYGQRGGSSKVKVKTTSRSSIDFQTQSPYESSKTMKRKHVRTNRPTNSDASSTFIGRASICLTFVAGLTQYCRHN